MEKKSWKQNFAKFNFKITVPRHQKPLKLPPPPVAERLNLGLIAPWEWELPEKLKLLPAPEKLNKK